MKKPINLFLQCYIKKYFDYSNRSSRAEYISFIILYMCIKLILIIPFIFTKNLFFAILMIGFVVVSFIPSINLSTRRLHDININGFWNLSIVPFVFLVNSDKYKNVGLVVLFLFAIVLLFLKGTEGANHYGKPPKN